MIFLLNNERILAEVFTLARLKMAQEFGVHPNSVSARVEIVGSKIKPTFGFPDSVYEQRTKEEIQTQMSRLWAVTKVHLMQSLAGLKERRNDQA